MVGPRIEARATRRRSSAASRRSGRSWPDRRHVGDLRRAGDEVADHVHEREQRLAFAVLGHRGLVAVHLVTEHDVVVTRGVQR
jgi:hypothetical protein